MSSPHAIRDFTFEVSFPTEAEAMEQQNRLASFVSERLTRTAEEVFDEVYPSDDSVVSIESLELDLGVVPASSYYEETEKRFRKQLEEILRLKLATVHSDFVSDTSGTRIRVMPRVQNELDIVMHFLDTGILPWSAARATRTSVVGTASAVPSRVKSSSDSAESQRSIEELLRRVIRDTGYEFAKRLQSADRPEIIARRLARQVSSQLLAEIVQILAASDNEGSERRWVEYASESKPHDKSPQETRLQHSSVSRSEAELAGAAAQHLDWETKLLRSMERATTELEAGLPPSTASREPRPPSQPYDHARLHRDLEEGLRHGDGEIVVRLWPELVKQPQLVIGVVRQLGQQGEIRHVMATALPDTMLRDIVAMLEPAAIRIVEEVIQKAEVFSRQVLKTISVTRAQLWERTLEFVLGEQQRTFDRDTYLAFLASSLKTFKMAEIDSSVGIPETLGFQLQSNESPVDNASVQLRTDISISSNERNANERPQQLAIPAESSEYLPGITYVLRAYEFYDQLAAVVLHGEPRRTPLIPAIDELRRRHPLQLRRLLRELNTAGSSRFLTFLPAEERRLLSEAFSEVVGRRLQLPSSIAEAASSTSESLTAPIGRPKATSPSPTVPLREFSSEAAPPVVRPAQPTDSKSEQQYFSPREVASALSAINQLTHAQTRRLIHSLDYLLARPDDSLIHVFERLLAQPGQIQAVIGKLPERQLARILLLSSDAGFHHLLLMAELIIDACLSCDLISSPFEAQQIKWQFLFDYLVRLRQTVAEEIFVSDFVTHITEQTANFHSSQVQRLILRHLQASSFPTLHATRKAIEILQALSDGHNAEHMQTLRTEVPSASPSDAPIPTTARTNLRDTDYQHIYIHNAGLVLAAPYLPRLFDRLELLLENKFRDEDAAQRAIHLLQYMANESLQPEEHLLPLNKILCGLDIDFPVLRRLDLLPFEKDAVYGLLQAMIDHWTAIGKTSIHGLRESFLQREGHLHFTRESWRLIVQQRAFDMLLDRIPWAFKLIKHPWMPIPIYVEWR